MSVWEESAQAEGPGWPGVGGRGVCEPQRGAGGWPGRRWEGGALGTRLAVSWTVALTLDRAIMRGLSRGGTQRDLGARREKAVGRDGRAGGPTGWRLHWSRQEMAAAGPRLVDRKWGGHGQFWAESEGAAARTC